MLHDAKAAESVATLGLLDSRKALGEELGGRRVQVELLDEVLREDRIALNYYT